MAHFRAALVMASLAAAVAVGVASAGYAGAAEDALVIAQASPAPAATPASLGSSEFTDDPDLRCDLLEVKRISGGALLIRFRVTNTAGGGGGLTSAPAKNIAWNTAWNDSYFIDPAENKKYLILTDSAGNHIGEIHDMTFKPGDKRVFWAKFPAPPATSTKISVTIAKFSPFDDIPVAP